MDINKELALNQFEQLNEALFHNHPDAIYMLDSDGKFLTVNEEVCRITGYPRESLIGKSYDLLIAEELKDFTRERFEESKADKPQRYETAIVTATGLRHLDVTNFPIKKGARLLAIFGIAKDITSKKERELELQKYIELLKEHNDELEVFRKILAHDMRKPVANAIGFAKLLQNQLPPSKDMEVRRYLLHTVEAIDIMLRDLNELIALQSAGEGVKEEIPVQQTVHQVLTQFQDEVSKVQASVHVDIDPSLQLFTIKAYFNSIVRNLVSNALKYSKGAPIIHIEACAHDSTVELRVQDNGIGMDLNLIGQDLFRMNKRFAPRIAEGNGLGLYIVKQQVQLMGGEIRVESQPGIGTTFIIHFPLT